VRSTPDRDDDLLDDATPNASGDWQLSDGGRTVSRPTLTTPSRPKIGLRHLGRYLDATRARRRSPAQRRNSTEHP
jgi:hypothetical protein